MHLVDSRGVLLGLLVVWVCPALGAESGAPSRGLEVAFRSAVQIPAGNVAENSAMSDAFGVQFPLWLDLGYRFDRWFIGAYGQYAFGLAGGRLDCGGQGLSCSIGGVRTGFQAQFHPAGRQKVDPWIGAGFGYEWQTIKVSDATASATVNVQGWELVHLGGGCDFAISETFRVGPFAEFSIDQFVQSGLTTPDGQSASGPIERKALHFWISIGVKLTGLF